MKHPKPTKGVKTLRNTNQKGFTLIELLVVIAIIGLLASVVLLALNSARAKSRDARRVADVRQISSAMELYFNDNSIYPPVTASLVPTYMGSFPTAPGPQDGPCADAAANAYTYATVSSSTDYTLRFCLGNTTGGLASGIHTLSSGGIQ